MVKNIFLFAFFISIHILLAQSPQIYINEFLASNLTTNPDMVDFGDFSDWIELYNDEDTDINLGGFYISDDFSMPAKWQIPPNTIIPAKGFYLLWADDYNDIPGQNYIREWWPNNIPYTTQWCHTNFKLSKDGDGIGLYESDGSPVDTLLFEEQVTDVSYGRQPDGSDNFYFFGEPTPIASNSTAGVNSIDYSAEVFFSIDGGFYESSVQVSLTSASGFGTIHYTTDGSKPVSSSSIYSGPVDISETTVLKARVFESGKIPGKTATQTFFISEVRNLPTVSISTDNHFLLNGELGIYRHTYKEREIPVSLEYFPLSAEQGFSLDAGMRIGGQNIYRFAQKPLNIYARGDYGYSHINYKIFDDLPYQAYKRLYLRNGGDDWPNTMFKEGMIVSLLKGQISNSIQNFKPAVLYLNGNYWGIHNLREKLDEQYFLLHYNVDPIYLDHLESDNSVIQGDSSEFIELLNFANSNNLSDPTNYDYVKSRIDIHNLMDFIIVQDWLANTSWSHNREVWRDNRTEKLWRWVLVDMDRGFNAGRISRDLLSDLYSDFGLFRRLCDNQDFVNEFVQRYSLHVEQTFDNTRITQIIDSLKSLIEDEMPRHIDKWGTYIDSLSIDEWGQTAGISSLTSWNNEIQGMKDFANQRSTYALQYLSDRFGLSGRSVLSISSTPDNKGKIAINGSINDIGNMYKYFDAIPLTIRVYPPPGYGLKQWKEVINSSGAYLISSGAAWKYRDEGNAPDADWMTAGFDDAGWKSGSAELGYGDGDESTVISYGANAQDKYITSYYRHTFEVNDPSVINELTLKLVRDDGAVVYLNGNEVVRSNMPAGDIMYSTLAASGVSGADESTYFEYNINKSDLLSGTNVLAVEIHQSSGSSSDVSFNLSLYAALTDTTTIENIIGADETITYSLTGNTELIAEFEETSSNILPARIQTSLTLSAENSPYSVTNDVIIEPGAILTIGPGVELQFAKDKSIYVQGKLFIDGNTEAPVSLHAYYPSEKWGAICFDESSESSVMNHVNISQATNGSDPENFFAAVSAINSNVSLNHVNFNDCTLPVSSQWSSMTIDHCNFENITSVGDYINCNGGNITITNSIFEGNEIFDMDAIDLGFITEEALIRNNIIRNFSGDNSDGIDIGDESENVIIDNNVILNCRDKGISVGQGSNVTVTRNAIAGCNLGMGIKDSSSYAEVINNTFYNNDVGVACFEKNLNRGGGKADISNTIFAKSGTASFTTDEFSEISSNYSISDTDVLPGTGNIFTDPWLINPDDNNFYLQANSPAIDAGNPETENDGDGSRADMGAFVFRGETSPDLVINEINYKSSPEFDSGDWIEVYNRKGSGLDLSGWVFMDETHKPSYVFQTGFSMPSGSYLVLCNDTGEFTTQYPDVENYYGDMEYGLSGSGEALYLYTDTGFLVDSLTYNDKAPWPVEADGSGSSLELVNPKVDNSHAVNWKASIGHGTPGKINSNYIVNVGDTDTLIPEKFALHPNFPNPFNPVTHIKFSIKRPAVTNLTIYNALGEKVVVLLDEFKTAGNYQVEFDAHNFASGIYFYRLQSGSNIRVKKMLLIK
ncbi:MAG: CotH kinase family protein [Calditrichaceae bacterium]